VQESWQWRQLFHETGPPLRLLERCLAGGKYEVASNYLLLVQKTEGLTCARQMAVKCVRALAPASHPPG
jgi:hypothetical protein